jgi:hypothetical protein
MGNAARGLGESAAVFTNRILAISAVGLSAFVAFGAVETAPKVLAFESLWDTPCPAANDTGYRDLVVLSAASPQSTDDSPWD